jgi:hypothetical protein
MGLSKQKAASNAGMRAGLSSGSKYLVESSRFRVVEAQWDKGIPTCVRIFPEYDHDNKRFLPYRFGFSNDKSTLGNWRMPLPIIKYVGTVGKKGKLSCILYDPESVRKGKYNKETNPYIVLNDECKEAANLDENVIKVAGKKLDTATWLKYFKGKLSQKAFAEPQTASFMQVALFTSRGKVVLNEDNVPRGLAKDDSPQLLLMTEKAADGLEDLLNETTDSFDPTKTINQKTERLLSKYYQYGDITSMTNGKFLILCNTDAEHTVSALTGDEEDDKIWLEGTGDNIAYSLALVDSIKVKPKKKRSVVFEQDISQFEDQMRKTAVDWFSDDLFRIMSDEELAVELVKCYANRIELVEYGWREKLPHLLKLDEVKSIMANRTQGFVPGGSDEDDDDEDMDDEDTDTIGGDDDDDDDDGGSSRKKRSNKLKGKGSSVYGKVKAEYGSGKKRRRGVEVDDDDDDDDDDDADTSDEDDDDVVDLSGSDVEDDDDDDDDDDDADVDADDEEEEEPTPPKRRPKSSKKQVNPKTKIAKTSSTKKSSKKKKRT